MGDLFDRGGANPDPVGVYFTLSGLQGKCTWIRGNHEQWLADYIKKYYSVSEKRRQKMQPYPYNSFAIMRQRMTEVDLLQLADLLWKRDRTMYLDEYMKSIWRNQKGNVYLLDCGCGLGSGRLACMCLETGERYYAD